MNRPLTGRHVLAIALVAFGTIIAVNIAMLMAATGTFPGLVVDNAYVASQDWNAKTAAQKALGWTAEVDYAEKAIDIRITGPDGQPVQNAAFDVTIGRPTTSAQDQTLHLTAGRPLHPIPIDLAPGAWRAEIRSVDGPEWRMSVQLAVAEAR